MNIKVHFLSYVVVMIILNCGWSYCLEPTHFYFDHIYYYPSEINATHLGFTWDLSQKSFSLDEFRTRLELSTSGKFKPLWHKLLLETVIYKDEQKTIMIKLDSKDGNQYENVAGVSNMKQQRIYFDNPFNFMKILSNESHSQITFEYNDYIAFEIIAKTGLNIIYDVYTKNAVYFFARISVTWPSFLCKVNLKPSYLPKILCLYFDTKYIHFRPVYLSDKIVVFLFNEQTRIMEIMQIAGQTEIEKSFQDAEKYCKLENFLLNDLQVEDMSEEQIGSMKECNKTTKGIFLRTDKFDRGFKQTSIIDNIVIYTAFHLGYDVNKTILFYLHKTNILKRCVMRNEKFDQCTTYGHVDFIIENIAINNTTLKAVVIGSNYDTITQYNLFKCEDFTSCSSCEMTGIWSRCKWDKGYCVEAQLQSRQKYNVCFRVLSISYANFKTNEYVLKVITTYRIKEEYGESISLTLLTKENHTIKYLKGWGSEHYWIVNKKLNDLNSSVRIARRLGLMEGYLFASYTKPYNRAASMYISVSLSLKTIISKI